MGTFVASTSGLKGVKPLAAGAAAFVIWTAFRKVGCIQARQNSAAEIVIPPRIHRLDFCGIYAREAGTFILSILPNSRCQGYLNWHNCAVSVAIRFTASNFRRIKLPLERTRPEDAWMWIPRGWKHLGTRPSLPESIIGHLT